MKTTNRKSKLVVGALLVGAALAGSGSAFAGNVPAWMAKIYGAPCMSMELGKLSLDSCPHNVWQYGNVPLDVNAGASDVTVSPSFTASNQGNVSGCYDDASCGRLLTQSSDGAYTHIGVWVCKEGGNGQTLTGNLASGVVPKGGWGAIEIRGIRSNGCSNQFKAIRY